MGDHPVYTELYKSYKKAGKKV